MDYDKTDETHYPNRDDWNESFWNNKYHVWITAQGIKFAVNANDEGEAIDYIIDYCQDNLPGLLFTHEEAHELRLESLLDYGDERYVDDYISGGNEVLHLSSHNVHMVTV